MAQTSINLTLSELKYFKKMNCEILPDLVKFIDNSKPINNRWNHYDNPTNFMTTNKKEKSVNETLKIAVRSSLNKIFNENFDVVLNELKSLSFTNKDQLNILVDLFFKKVITEKNNIGLYISLTKELFSFNVENKVFFKTLLLSKCHTAFTNIVVLGTNITELDGIFFKFKDEVITFMKYIGELYNNNILKDTVIEDCLATVFSKIEKEEMSLYIIDIVCALFDTTRVNIKAQKPEIYELFYGHFIKIKDSKLITKKDKFLIMDITDKCN